MTRHQLYPAGRVLIASMVAKGWIELQSDAHLLQDTAGRSGDENHPDKIRDFQSRSPGHISDGGAPAVILLGRRAISWLRLKAYRLTAEQSLQRM